MTVFRLGSFRHPANEGLGASLYGGRWNHKGTAVIYTAASRALCALEVLANETLPPGWDAGQPTNLTRDIGTDWAACAASAVLAVPSAVIPREFTYILNPRHPDFTKIRFLRQEPFYFDDRLGRV